MLIINLKKWKNEQNILLIIIEINKKYSFLVNSKKI